MEHDKEKNHSEPIINPSMISPDMIAPGIDDDEELDRKATPEEIERGEYTKVIKLSNDEYRPS
ncbi:hypothetical protein ACJ2A9_01855 [Anaerobacillus sp. MEB173]|uniref:hypothetical protein n=1 Tax=Anaerobacillus sp. MEB173 TaxID=3383345 RepID=UPI003F8F1758